MAIGRLGPAKLIPSVGMAGRLIHVLGQNPNLLMAGWELLREVGNPRIAKIRGSYRCGLVIAYEDMTW
jgi:hypothetical protein